MSIIFQDEFLKVDFHRGNSDFLLITFSPVNVFPKNNDDFYAKNIIINNNINAISFTALKNHWYPYKIMEDVVNNIQYIISEFDKIIMYGVSMGGYAAVKYSKILRASHIITMSP